MDQVLCDLTFAYTYIDDVLIASSTPEELKLHLQAVLQRFGEHGIVITGTLTLFTGPSLAF